MVYRCNACIFNTEHYSHVGNPFHGFEIKGRNRLRALGGRLKRVGENFI
jgi:hypothetical protein